MEFVCKVGTPAGEVVERTFSATNETELRSELEQQGFYLFQIRRGLLAGGLGRGRRRVPQQVLMIFGQELAALLKAGLPLVQCLDVMLDRQRDPLFKRSLTSVRDRIKTGVALSDAFAAEGELYPPMFPASLIAGERSGNLEAVLRRFVQYLRLNESLKRKAISSAIYPLVLFTLMVALVAILMVFVVPRFQSFYEGLDAELPLLTQVLIAVATTVADNLLWVLLALGAGIAWIAAWSRREGSGLVLDRWLLRVPYVGGLMRMYASSQLARTLSTLLAGGLPLLNALETAASSIGNRAMAASVSAAAPLIREGKSLTTALESTGMLDGLTLEMVKVGEQTGALGDMLNAVAEFYDEDLDARIARVLALVEPVMLVLMAVIVATMLLAFYLPLFESIAAIQERMSR
jgi:type IV pilus assembly protein PilC